MNTNVDPARSPLAGIVMHLSASSQFIAHDLALLKARGVDSCAALGIDRATLDRLALCKTPRRGRWLADVHAIANHVGVRPAQLAALLLDVPAVQLPRQ